MDPVKNDEMKRMFNYYRNNLTGEPPAGNADDLYNDRVDNIKIDDRDLTQIGTDEAGNPIMANPVNMPSEPEPQQREGIVGNIIDFAYDRLQQSQGRPDLSGTGPVGAIMTGITDFVTASDEERRNMLNVPQRMENAAKRFVHSMSNATELEHTELYENYFYNAEKKNAEINRIANLLKIDSRAFANDRDLYVKAALAADRVERMGKFKKYQDADGNIDMQKIYADIPGLAETQRRYGTPAAAMALGNIEGIQSVNDVYSNAFTRFVGSVYAGARRGLIADRRSAIWEAARSERRLPTAEEQAQLDQYDEELRNLPKYNYNTIGGALGGFVGGAAENGAMILKSQAAGLAAGAVVTRLAGPKWGGYARDAAAVYVMADQISGSQYEELMNKVDAKGNRMYTPEQAAMLARAQGIGEAMLEQYSLKQIGSAMFGKSAAPALQDIIRKNQGLEAIKAGVKDYALVKLKEAGKSGIVSFSAEAAEEFEQAASDMLMENVAQVLINGKDADTTSMEDILMQSTAQMVEAFPSLAGFSIIGFAGNPIANTRAALGFRSHVQRVMNDKILQGQMANAHYGEVLSGIWANRKNIQELHDKAPEAEKTILDAQNKIAGMEYGFVDVKTLYQQEGGRELVQQIADKAGISAEELADCMNGSGMLQVKTSALMQMDLQDAQQKAVQDNVTASLDSVTAMQFKELLDIAKGQEESLKNFNDETYKKAVDNIIAARFQDKDQAKLAREIIEANYDNPQAEFKRRLDAVNAEIMEEIGPVLHELESGMGQGTTLVRDAEGNPTGARVSNNDPWYSNYFADYGRAPSKEWMIDNAIRIASGRQDPRYGLVDYQNNTEESRAGFAPIAEKLDRLVEQRDALNSIKDRMQQLKAGEITATATLSPEGLKVYDAAIRLMGTSENKEVQKVGRYNALFVARYADRMAKVFSRVKQKPYTAIDYVRDYLKIDVNAVQGNLQNAAQLFQVSLEEFNRQKEEVRKQYEGTDQWMKAPNGKPTNLTEDQWVTVRTPAFKNWFGDWEREGRKEIFEERYGNLTHPEEKVKFDKQTPIKVEKGQIVAEKSTTAFNITLSKFLEKYPKAEYVDTVVGKVKIDANSVRDSFAHRGALVKADSTLSLVEGMKVASYITSIKDYDNPELTYHYFIYKIDYDGQEKYVLCRVKESINARRVYLHEVTDAEGIANVLQKHGKKISDTLKAQRPAAEADAEHMRGIALYAYILNEFINPVNASKVVDENGEPLVVYHGSDADFDTFDRTKSRANMDIQGNFFSPWKEDAQGYGQNVRAFFLNIRKPANEGQSYKALNKFKGQNGAGIKARENLTSQGFDGVNNENEEYIAFEPNQIKDATGRNVGFDPESGNVYLQSAYHGTGARFEKFNTDFMGTGEGAQAHGWGLYFAKDKTVAEDYRNKLTQRRVLYKGREVDSTVIEIGGKQYELEGGQWYSDGQLVDDDTLLSRLQQINDADENIAVVLRNAENRLALYENSPYEKEIRDDVDFFKTNRDSINKKPGRLAEAAEYIKRNAKDENSNAIAAVINTLKQEIRIDDGIASGMMLDGTAETNRDKFGSVMETKKRLQGILQTIEENKDDLKLERGGQVFEVDVPEDDVLLDEQKQFVDQPKKVQTAIRKLWKSIGYNTNALRVMAGQEIYKTLSSELGSPQKASLALNDVGVKGIAYDGRADGRCFVVFDDNAISIMQKFYQRSLTADEKLMETSKLWNSWLEQVEHEGVEKYASKHGQEFFDFMDVPLVLQFFGIPYKKIKVQGNFVYHSLRVNKHPGMKMEYLKQLPEAMANPWMVTRGKNGRYTFVLQLKDKYGATIVVPVAIDKNASRYGIAEPLDVAESAYGKTEEDNKTPDYMWLVGEKGAIAEDRILYVNKQSTREFAEAVRVSYPLADQLSSALFKLIISAEAGNIKTEEDLAAYKAEHPSMYQQQSRLKGSIAIGERGRRIISLFEGADQSTFMHEMAHLFLLDLQEIAGIDPNGMEAKDLKTIMDWAQYRPGQSDEYKGTSSEAEFRKREEAIKAAVAAGNMAEAERLKDEWMQERFARGFEEYLRSGEAPAMGLKRAFRQLKKWLVQIYHDVTGAGVRATPEVEAVMARMVASEEEIEALAAANNIARLRKLDPDILSGDMDAMHDRWQEEAKEKAKEKLLRELMKQYQQQNLKDLDKKLEAFREATQRQLQETPCFICEELLNQGNSMDIALEICEFSSEQEYREALDAAGGSLQKAVDREVNLERKRLMEQMPGREVLYDMAEEALHSGNYDARLSVLEAEMLEARKKSYQDLPKKVQAAFTDLDGALGDLKKESWEEVKKKIRGLKYATRWQAEEYAMIREFEDAAAKLEDPEDREAVERLRAEYERIKQQVTRNKEWVRGVRDATQGQFLAIKNRAQREMDKQPISAATNPRHWRRLGLQEGRTAWKELGKAQGKGEKNGTLAYSNAVGAKVQQALFDAMTSIAFENRKELDKMLNGRDGIYNRARRMADPKYKADATIRYFHNHILYIMGLRNTDAIAPAQEKTFTELLAELRQAQEFDEEIPAWMIQLAEAKQPLDKNYQTLTMDEFRQLKKLTDVLYTLARNKNRLLTLDMDMDTVRAEMIAGYESHTDYEVGNQRINEIKGGIGDMMNSLLKPEVILSILGGKDGPFVKYIYRILYSAAEAEEKALEQEAKAEKALYGMYTHEELRAMVNDPIMVEGKDGTKTKLQIGADTDITKEHLICMALNRGNKLNWARLVVGLFDSQTNADMEIHGNELMQILQTHLTKKDWTFVQAMWDHIGTFADPVSGVMEKSLGVPLNRVKADAFTVTLPDGETLQMQGGYYPIVKDSGKSSRQSEFEQMEEAKAIGGASVFGAGMGATKNRSDNEKLNQGPLMLSLNVASRHIKAQIHLVHARMAVRDAYKVLNDASVKDMIERACGTDTFKMLNEYVLNCWAPPIQPHSWYEKAAAAVRGKTVSAIMGYRTMTALLNTFPNVVYMAQEIGTGNALAAIADFYKDWRTNRDMILDTSVFMRNRATNMDRDLDAQQEKFLNRHEGRAGKLVNAIDKATGGKTAELDYLINKYANKLIEETDMMVSMPLYKWQLDQTYSEEIAKGVPAEEALEKANFEATRRVTKVFGSSRAVDTSAVQRSRNEFVKLLTPFFTFANTMMNAVWSKQLEQKLQGKNFGNEKIALRDSKGNVLLDEEGNIRYTTEREQNKLLFRFRYGKFVRAMLMNYLLGALVETWMRQLPDALVGTGDDDDDEDKIGVGVFKVDAKEYAKNVISSAAAGFPGINMIADTLNTYVIEGRMYDNRGVGVVSGSVERYRQVGKDLLRLTKDSDTIDVLDLVRDCVKASNTLTGFSDTLTDAIFNTARFAVDDYQLNNPDDLREYIAKSLFDRKLKKK